MQMQYRRRRAQSGKELALTTPPHGPSKTGLTEYLASLRRINEALSGLKKSNLRRSQKTVTQMTSHLKAGSLQLEDLFRQASAEGSKSVEPLHFITKYNIIDLPFPTFRPQKINMLAVLNDFLSSTLAASAGIQSNAPRVYVEVRGPHITNLLASLTLATVNTTRRTSAAPYDQGSNSISVYTNVLEATPEAEYGNICHFSPTTEYSQVYLATTAMPMGVFKKTLADLNVFVKQNMATDWFLAFDVIKNVQPARVRLKSKTGEQGGFAGALKPLRTTAQSSFSYFVEDVKKTCQGLIALSLDNTVAEMTVNVMSRLRQMADCTNAISSLSVSLGEGNWNRPYTAPALMPPSFNLGADGTLLPSNFCSDAIDQLTHELEKEAGVMIKKNSTVAVFMVNNIHFIETNIRTSDVRKIMSNQAQAKVEKWRKDAIKMYMEQWKECAAFLMDVTYTKHQGGGRLNLNSREMEGVEEKFKNINTVFQELIQKQKSYTFRDEGVRALLSKEIGFSGQLYGRLYDKYEDLMRDKYVKYDRHQLDTMLAQV
ncbi:Cullin repeat-like-containing domain protein [Tuber brumale]|nr:Cullin repeat-like-containing domain protein [Tuber brumale]